MHLEINRMNLVLLVDPLNGGSLCLLLVCVGSPWPKREDPTLEQGRAFAIATPIVNTNIQRSPRAPLVPHLPLRSERVKL